MAVEIGDKITLQPKESIARIDITCNAKTEQGKWSINYYFETGNYDDDGKLNGETTPSRNVHRIVAEIKDDKDVLSMMAMLKTKGYEYREEDIEREKKEQEAEAERKQKEIDDVTKTAERAEEERLKGIELERVEAERAIEAASVSDDVEATYDE